MSGERSVVMGPHELQLELGHLLSDVAGRGAYLSGDAPYGHRVDARNRAQRVVPGAHHGVADWRHSHHGQSMAGPARQRLRGIVPQHPAAGADVPVVFRAARAPADRAGRLAQAASRRLVLHGGGFARLLHLGTRRRAGARRHFESRSRPGLGCPRAWAHAGAVLRLCAAADGVSRHPAAADVRISQHHQEQRGRAHHRAHGAHGAGARHAGILVPGVRGLHCRHRHLHRNQHRGDLRHALGRATDRCARLHRRRTGGGHTLRRSMFADFDFDVIIRSLPYLFYDGMTFTLMLTALATCGGIIFGTLLAMMRLSGLAPLSLLAGGYVNLMRAVPLVLVIFWFYFLVPFIGQWVTGASRPIQVGAFASSLVTFTLFEAAYFAEIMRAGIQSIRRGQVQAAQALGMTYLQTMGYIVLPQAFRNMLPVLLTQTIVLFQDTSLVYVLSITDFLGAASKVAQRDGRLVEMYLFAALVYFTISCVASYGVRRLQARIAIVR